MSSKLITPDAITKATSYYDEGEDFHVGELVDLEDYPPHPEKSGSWDWPGCYWCVIVNTEPPDADMDDYGQTVYYQAYAEVAVVPKKGEDIFIEKVYVNSLFKRGELYGQ